MLPSQIAQHENNFVSKISVSKSLFSLFFINLSNNSADVKANISQQEIKYLVTYLTILCKKYLQKCNINRGCIFDLILVGIPSILILSVKNKGLRGLLN